MSRKIHKFKRDLKIHWVENPVSGSGAAFLWGPRQIGKTTLLHEQLPGARFYDLLDTELRAELAIRPRSLREETLANRPEIVVIDEVQEAPGLLPEVHWLLENTSTRFVLCGSSARKLRRKATGLLGGRAIEFLLHPLTSAEIPNLDLTRALNHGTLPVHYQVEEPRALLRSYVNSYIKEEIIDESATRNVPAFSRFLQVIGLTHGQQMNYTNIARESGVSAATIRNYFQILEDTLLGFTLEAWRKPRKRRLAETAKFYLFDTGVANFLHPEAQTLTEGSDLFGRAFEHFILNEVRAYRSYREVDTPLAFWRTSSGFEVDIIVGDMDVAVECKSSRRVRDSDLRGLRALLEEHPVGRALVVCREERPRTLEGGIEILPWAGFCQSLWDGDLF
jgi:predicted AAA+ superfamily ATPase